FQMSSMGVTASLHVGGSRSPSPCQDQKTRIRLACGFLSYCFVARGQRENRGRIRNLVRPGGRGEKFTSNRILRLVHETSAQVRELLRSLRRPPPVSCLRYAGS